MSEQENSFINPGCAMLFFFAIGSLLSKLNETLGAVVMLIGLFLVLFLPSNNNNDDYFY